MMATTTESSLQRAMQAYCLQLSESQSLDHGVAFTSPRFPGLNCANQLREVIVERPEAIPGAFAAAERHFAERGVRCLRWSVAIDEPIDATASFLSTQGFRREEYAVMTVRESVDLPVDEGIRVLPARAMRKALNEILHERCAGFDEAIRAMTERLDEPQLDGFVAMRSGTPAGWCSFFQVGDFGLVADLYVVENCRRQGVGVALVSHVLKLARRLLMRKMCLRVGVEQSEAIALFGRCGFERDGTAVEFVRD